MRAALDKGSGVDSGAPSLSHKRPGSSTGFMSWPTPERPRHRSERALRHADEISGKLEALSSAGLTISFVTLFGAPSSCGVSLAT